MNTIIRLKIKKEVDTPTARKILKLKGSLIAQSFTDIIHYDDEGDEFYVHHFSTPTQKKHEVLDYASSFISQELLTDIIIIL